MRDSRLLVRFVLVGLLNTGFSYSVYALFVWLGFPYALANFVALVLGIVFSFRTQGSLVFRHAGWSRLRRFVPVWLAIYLVNIALIGLLMRLGFSAYMAGAMALVPVTALSFLSNRYFVFRLPDDACIAAPPEPSTRRTP